MVVQKFATLKSNIRFLVGLSATSFVLRIVGELVYNLVMATDPSSQ